MNLFEQNKQKISENLRKSYLSEEEVISKSIDSDLLCKGKRATLGEVREWNGKKMQKTVNGWVPAEGKGESTRRDILEFSPKNKTVSIFKNQIDSDTDYLRWPKSISIYTLEKLGEYKDKLKELKRKDSFKDLKKETKEEVFNLDKYLKFKIDDLKIRLREEKEEAKHLAQYGHSTKYIDDRMK